MDSTGKDFSSFAEKQRRAGRDAAERMATARFQMRASVQSRATQLTSLDRVAFRYRIIILEEAAQPPTWAAFSGVLSLACSPSKRLIDKANTYGIRFGA